LPVNQFDNEFHKTIVDNLADGVYFVDPGREITYWNRGAERITGYASGAVVGHRCFDNILDHVDAEGNSLCHTICPLAATMRDGQPREVSVWLRHAEGYRKPVRIRTSPVRNGDGAIVGAVEVFSDDSAVLRALEDADRARRARIAGDALGGCRDGLALRQTAKAGSERHGESHGQYEYAGAGAAGSLGEHRDGDYE
jgi:PAS domain S-box-containing protein